MTAPRDELADLRRRAYGRGGLADGDDLARLQLLEDELRASDVTLDGALDGPTDGPPDGETTPPEPPTDAPAPVTSAAPAKPPREPLRSTLRRRRVLLVLLAVAVVAAVVAAVWLTTRSGATILRRVAQNDTAAQQQLASSLRNFGVDPDSYVQFESFDGLAVWTARIPDRGVRCLLVVDQDAASETYNGVVEYSCTPEGLVPSVDVTQFAAAPDGDLGDTPVGSVGRFVFRGDRVEVTVVEARDDPEIPTPAPR